MQLIEDIPNESPPPYEEVAQEKVESKANSLHKEGDFGAIHYIRKEDTLPGLALKYGIEVIAL